MGSFIAVASAFLLMITSDGGKGGLAIWPLFGATNQMLAGLTLILICLFLIKEKKKILSYLVPAIFVILITSVGLIYNLTLFLSQKNYFLVVLSLVLSLIQLWILVEAMNLFRTKKRES
ncbi:MAG: hypothetical protein CME60_13715 [Halobacteriovoraceae bacterium]|nr:hypothetical protein [Halobacteriovoraceae bacterium]